ncbi:MAG: metal-dependent transcriptional regulator [Candidatus Woesearchaeota archaeon]
MKLDLHAHQRLRLVKEMYLKAILQLSQTQADVKQSHLVEVLQVKKSSVSETIQRLQHEGLLEYEPFKSIRLTKKGLRDAKLVLRKYQVLYQFLSDVLKVSDPHEEACSLEHACSLETITKLEKLLRE